MDNDFKGGLQELFAVMSPNEYILIHHRIMITNFHHHKLTIKLFKFTYDDDIINTTCTF